MRILVTGAGGAAAISVWKSLHEAHTLFMADIDPCAAGLYLVPALERAIIPRGDADNFVSAILTLCEAHNIELVIPTVDTELFVLSQHHAEFRAKNIHLALSKPEVLALCRNKHALLDFCKDTGLTPASFVLKEDSPIDDMVYPCFAKPCLGSGSNGAMVIPNKAALMTLPKNGSYLIQELLPGEEYSVDVYIHSSGHPLAAVPRLRMKIDSGIAVAAQTKMNPTLIEMALIIAKKVGITYIANIQFKANAEGLFKLLEINPRFPGTLPLTAAAGIDMPALLIKDILGEPMSLHVLPFKEIMVVRYWTEKFIEIDEWKRLCL